MVDRRWNTFMHSSLCSYALRTTLDLNDEVLRTARQRAANDGIPLRAVVERALRTYLEGGPRKSGYRLRWRPERGRLRPGVRVDDRDALFDLMEGRD